MGDTGGPFEALVDLGHPSPLPPLLPGFTRAMRMGTSCLEGGEEFHAKYSGLVSSVQVLPVCS